MADLAEAQCTCEGGEKVNLDCEECVNRVVADGACTKCNNVGCSNYDKSLDDLLGEAASDGNIKAMETFLKAGVNMNNVASNGWTPLTGAASANQIETVRLLINWATNGGQSVTSECSYDLGKSLCQECSATVQELDDTGCSASVSKSDDRNCSANVNQSEERECSAFINKPNWEGKTALSIAAKDNFREIAQILVMNGADVNHKDNDEQSPIDLAALCGNTGIVEVLLQAGVSVNSESLWNNETPLMIAALEGRTQTVQFLISKGADIMMQDTNGDRALHFAAKSSYVDIVTNLIEAGAEVNCTNKELWTPLISSCINRGHTEIIKVLLSAGADVRLRSRRCCSALDMAIIQKFSTAQQLSLLYASGASIRFEIIKDGSKYRDIIPQFIIDDQEPMLDLLGLCRKTIRSVLLSPAQGNKRSLCSAVVAQLPLPQLLRESLLFCVDI